MAKSALLINLTSIIGHHGCTLVNRQIERLCDEAGIALRAGVPLFADLDGLDLAGIDMILVNGEGTLHHDRPGARRIADIAVWAAATGRPAALINTVFEGNSADTAARLKAFTLIYARDRRSQAEFARFGLEAGCTPDLTLSWRPQKTAAADGRIVITDSTQRVLNARLHELAGAGAGRTYLPLIARPPRLAGAAAGGNLRRRLRYWSKRAVARLLPPGLLWRDRYRMAIPDFDDFVAFLGERTGLLIAGRFHAVCLALVLELPFLALKSNTWKVDALLEEAGLTHRLMTNTDEIERLLQDNPVPGLAFSPDELARIRAFTTTARNQAHAMFADIARRCA